MLNSMKGIYRIYNQATNKVYIGRSINLERRLRVHKRTLNKGNHYNIHLQNSYNKYKDQFIFEIIECIITNDASYIKDREEYWVAFYNSNKCSHGYNKTSGGNDGPMYPYCVISACKRDRTGVNNPFYGKTMSKEAKAILSAKAKLRPNNFKGKHHTDITKEKLSKFKKEYFKHNRPSGEDPTIYLWSHTSGEEFIGTRVDLVRKLRIEYGRCASSDIRSIILKPGRTCRGWKLNVCQIK